MTKMNRIHKQRNTNS